MKQILFVCIGNSIRSQMAEAFARKYGSDVMRVESVGLSPALVVDELTKAVMAEVGISMETHISKGTDFLFPGTPWDLVVNISGHPLPPELDDYPSVAWKIADPVGEPKEEFIAARDQIEKLVMRLVLDIRNKFSSPVAMIGWESEDRDSSLTAKAAAASPTHALAEPDTTGGAPTRASARIPAWMNLTTGGSPPQGATPPATSQGQPLSRGMRRAIETGELPRSPRPNPPPDKSGGPGSGGGSGDR